MVEQRHPGPGTSQAALDERDRSEVPLLLHVDEAAKLLGIGTTLAYELVGQGKLPHVRLGRAVRVPRVALEAWIEANTVGPTRRARALK